VSPGRASQSPAHLDRGVERGLERLSGEAGEAHEGARLAYLQRPEPKAVLLELVLDLTHERVALSVRDGIPDVAHHLGIGVQVGEGIEVGRLPATEQQPWRGEARTEAVAHASGSLFCDLGSCS
jgi:hypothetical protein